MQAQISLCAKIGYMYYYEYAHLLKKGTEHTCMSAIYYDQSSDIKADRCKMIVTFDTLAESKILDAGNILILSSLQKPWTIVCKVVHRTFELKYSTYHTLNWSELHECSLTAGNYLLSQVTSNCGGMPEMKDGFFTTYYAFNRIVLDMLMEKFDIQVDDDMATQLVLLHSDIPGCDLPAIDFVSPSEEAQESHILKEQDAMIYMSCICKTACFLANYAPHSLQAGRKTSIVLEWSSSLGTKSDSSLGLRPQPIRGLPAIEPGSF